MDNSIRFESELLGIIKVNEDTKILRFSVPDNFSFVAGQFVLVAFYREGKRVIREYSIISSPQDKGFIDLYFKKIENGFVSTSLFNLKIGEKVEMRGPKGFFTTKRSEGKDLVFISSGTGFAPFASMLRDKELIDSGKKVILVRGFRKEDDLVMKNELNSLSQENPNFEFYEVLSQPESEEHELKGYVQDFLKELVPENFEGEFYVCGLKEMVTGVKEELGKMGVEKERIFSERYD